MKNRLFATILFASVTGFAIAQEDVPNSKDHELLSRYEGAWITKYNHKQFDELTFPTSAQMVDNNTLKNPQTVAGETTMIEYEVPEGVSAAQVFLTYQTQLTKAGFKTIFSCRNQECGNMPGHYLRAYVEGKSSQVGNSMIASKGSVLAASGTYEDNLYTVVLTVGDYNQDTRYILEIVKSEKLDTDKVDVATVSDQLDTEGKFAFYGILFELNSATLQAESAEALQLMADYLKANPSQKVLIVGHTDNTGDLELNMTLSQKRSAQVAAELALKYGVESSQMTAVGVGMASPVATNKSEEGRALNRRVELVLK